MSSVPVDALVLHQRSVPIDARERLLELVVPWRDLPDRVVLATCHRVEIYLSGADAQRADRLAAELLVTMPRGAGVELLVVTQDM